MRRNFLFVLVFLVLGISACSEYEKALKSPEVSVKYKKAIEYYEKKDFTRASTLLEQVIPFYRGTSKADTINIYFARCYYMQRDYVMAGHYFKEFTQTYPRSHFAEEAEYMVAYCYYLSSPKPELDQQTTVSGLDAMQLYLVKYPNTSRMEECNKIVRELRERLMTKSYVNAKMYFDLELYKAAIITIRNSLSDFPDSKYREELMFLMVKSNYLYAQKSIYARQKERFQNTVDEYYSFIAEYPASKFSKEVKEIYEKSSELLN
jgi:outer membrane protein assembly factor BamD